MPDNTVYIKIKADVKDAIEETRAAVKTIQESLDSLKTSKGKKSGDTKLINLAEEFEKAKQEAKLTIKEVSKVTETLDSKLATAPEKVKRLVDEIIDLKYQIRDTQDEAEKTRLTARFNTLRGQLTNRAREAGPMYEGIGGKEGTLAKFLSLQDKISSKQQEIDGIIDRYLEREKQVTAEKTSQKNATQGAADSAKNFETAEEKGADTAKNQSEYQKQLGRDIDANTDKQKKFNEAEQKGADTAKEQAEYEKAKKATKEPIKITLGIDADVTQMTIAQLVRHLNELKAKMREIEKDGIRTKEQEEEFNRLDRAVFDTKEQIKNVRKEYKTTSETARDGAGANKTFADSFKSFSDTFVSISQANGLLGKLKAGISAIGPEAMTAGLMSKEALTMATAGLNIVIEVVTRLLTIIQTVFNALKTLASAIINAFKKVFDMIKKVGTAIKDNIIKLANKAKSSFGDMFSFSGSDMRRTLQMLTKYIFGVRSFFFLYRKLRGAVKDGLENLVQFESGANETNVAITELRTSLLYLKNAWAAAFAPIINVVYPILVRFMDALAAVGNMIARFVGALTGQATVLQALRVSAGDYAESLASAGGSAKKAADAQEELNDRLAAFDDLNVLGVDDDDDKNKSPSGGGGGADDMPSIDDMFERVNVKMTDLMRQLREAWETGDGFELGQTIADALNRGLEKAHDWLTGEGREKILKIANLIGTTMDGILSNGELASNIGQVLADVFGLAMDTINTVITPERMYMIGVRMAEVLNTAIPQIVPKLGETFGNLIKSAISNAWGFISTADFASWGTALGDAINNFFGEMGTAKGVLGGIEFTHTGWQLFGMTVTEFANKILDFFINAINEVDWVKVGESIGEFLGNIDIGTIKSGMSKLFETIRTAFSEFMSGLGDFNIFESSNSAFSKKPASASSVLPATFTAIYESIGVLASHLPQWISSFSAFIDGLPWDKITAWISELPDKFDRLLTTIERFVDAVTPLLERLGEQLGITGDDAESGIGKVDRATDNLANIWNTFRDTPIGTISPIIAPWATRILNDIIEGTDALTDAGSYIEDGVNEEASLMDSIRDTLSSAWESTIIGERVGETSPFSFVVSEIRSIVKGANDELSGLQDSFKITADKVKTNFNLEGIVENVKGIVQASNTSLDEIPDKFTAIKGSADTESAGLKDTFSTSFNTIKEESADSAKVIDENFTMAATNIKDTFIEAWNEIKKSISEGGDMFVALSEGMGNSMKALLNGMINGINVSITKPLQDISKSFNILRTLDVNGTRPFAGIPYLNVPTIPRLAQGAVIPPNNQFLAMLGDQKSGTNIEAPLDTIKQAVGEEFAPYADAIVEAVLQVVQAVNNKPVLSDKDIGQANSRYEGRQRIIRGTMI